ncbi:Protein translocase subunit SecA [Bienertia sinuspersici]
MDLNTIKENLTFPIKAPQYRVGVDGFMSFANNTLTHDGRLRCPCVKCVNNKLLNPDDVNYHLLQYGIMRNYSTWVFHRESVDQVPTSTSTEPTVEKETLTHMDMRQLVHDAFGHNDDDPYIGDNMDESIPGPNKEAQSFYSLLKDAEQELWPGCELTLLSLLMLLFHIKSTNKWTNKSFNDLLHILIRAIPHGANLPKSFAEAKKVIEKLGLGYVKIHACPNHCQLFWKDKVNDDTCSVCGASRWKSGKEQSTSMGRKKKKGVPAKVLRYFPLKPRLKRLYMSKHTAALMRWHDEERTKDDKVLAHPADSEAWKSFDTRYPEFGDESRNIRLGLASDGFNPFGMMSSTYSCWPVVLVPYNLPPWMCLKQSSLILSTLIPGQIAQGKKLMSIYNP